MRNIILLLGCWLAFFSGNTDKSFTTFRNNFITGYGALNIPDITYDYKEYFGAIPADSLLEKQTQFFLQQQSLLSKIVKPGDAIAQLDYDHIDYEITFHLRRIALEQRWVQQGRKIPQNGLHQLADYKEWYAFFIKKYTSTDITPEEVFALGKSEVKRVQGEIKAIQQRLGMDSFAFYRHLQNDSFYIKDKAQLIAMFEKVDSIVRTHLPGFVGNRSVPQVYAMEWQDAGANTPPGIYLNHRSTTYGKDVFQFNFYGRRYNRRAIEWLYMHEAIPGHHLQSTLRKENELQQLFIYPGNFEGWACYIEYLGKDLGLLQDTYSCLGKWEWDLVRSARLVMDAGIHYYGWSRQQALDYWMATIPGQDDIAEREIARVTNWCGQALSYKVGADFIMKMKTEWILQHPNNNIKDFHLAFLDAGQAPLAVLKKNLLAS